MQAVHIELAPLIGVGSRSIHHAQENSCASGWLCYGGFVGMARGIALCNPKLPAFRVRQAQGHPSGCLCFEGYNGSDEQDTGSEFAKTREVSKLSPLFCHPSFELLVVQAISLRFVEKSQQCGKARSWSHQIPSPAFSMDFSVSAIASSMFMAHLLPQCPHTDRQVSTGPASPPTVVADGPLP